MCVSLSCPHVGTGEAGPQVPRHHHPFPLPLGLTQSTLRLITLIIVSFGVISLIIRNQPRGSIKISPDWPTDGTVNFFWKIALFFNCAYVALINVDCPEVSSTIEIPHTSLDDTRRIFIRLVY